MVTMVASLTIDAGAPRAASLIRSASVGAAVGAAGAAFFGAVVCLSWATSAAPAHVIAAQTTMIPSLISALLGFARRPDGSRTGCQPRICLAMVCNCRFDV